jgi:hypothetical protein
MAVLTDSIIRKAFLAKFSRGLKSYGFDILVPFNEPEVGLSFKKKLRNDGYISLIKLAVLDDGEPRRRKLFASTTYGKDNGSSIEIRSLENTKRDDPVDLDFNDEFYYDPKTNQIYHGLKKISPLELLNEVYGKHIKPTRTLAGLLLRVRFWFWRYFLRDLVELLSKITKTILFIISGTHYSYDAFFEGTEWADRYASPQGGGKENSKGGEEKLNFLGYKAKRWPILFYCSLHLSAYLLCSIFDFKPHIIVVLLQNNFLTLVYVVVSISLVESVIPDSLKKFIRVLSRLSLKLSFRKIVV